MEIGHKKLEVWQKAINFVTKIYEVTKKFPTSEQFGLISQIRRASVSIPSNIAEGATRKSTKEYIQFLYMALGSASELDTQIEISKNLKYISNDIFKDINNDREEISKMLSGLISSLKKKL